MDPTSPLYNNNITSPLNNYNITFDQNKSNKRAGDDSVENERECKIKKVSKDALLNSSQAMHQGLNLPDSISLQLGETACMTADNTEEMLDLEDFRLTESFMELNEKPNPQMEPFSSDEVDIIFLVLGGNLKKAPFTGAIRDTIPGKIHHYCGIADMWVKKWANENMRLSAHQFFFHHLSHDFALKKRTLTREAVVNIIVRNLSEDDNEMLGGVIKELCAGKKVDVETARSVIQTHLKDEEDGYLKRILAQLEGSEKFFEKYKQHISHPQLHKLIVPHSNILSRHLSSVWADDFWLRNDNTGEIRVYKKLATIAENKKFKPIVTKIQDLLTDAITVVKFEIDISNSEYLKNIHARHPNMPVTIQKPPIWSGENVKGNWEDQYEFYPGGDLQSLIDKLSCTPLSSDLLNSIIKDCLEALTAMHPKGIFHLDIKPANIMLDIAQRAVLIDWTPDTMNALYTPYGDIEKLRRHARDEAKFNEIQNKRNVYAMGLIFFQLATGISNIRQLLLIYSEIKDYNGNTITYEEVGNTLNPSINTIDSDGLQRAMENLLFKAGCEKKLKELILSMTHPDVEKRIDSGEAQAIFRIFCTDFLQKKNEGCKV